MRQTILTVSTLVLIGMNSMDYIYGWTYIVWTLCLVGLFYGGVLWAKDKNRNWTFAFLCLLAPIGFIPMMLLKDKSTGVRQVASTEKGG